MAELVVVPGAGAHSGVFVGDLLVHKHSTNSCLSLIFTVLPLSRVVEDEVKRRLPLLKPRGLDMNISQLSSLEWTWTNNILLHFKFNKIHLCCDFCEDRSKGNLGAVFQVALLSHFAMPFFKYSRIRQFSPLSNFLQSFETFWAC